MSSSIYSWVEKPSWLIVHAKLLANCYVYKLSFTGFLAWMKTGTQGSPHDLVLLLLVG